MPRSSAPCLHRSYRLFGYRPAEMGSSLVLAIVTAALLISSALILTNRAFLFFTGIRKSSDFRDARQAAEYGAAELTNSLNKDGNSYLLITQPACWQSTSLPMAGIYMPSSPLEDSVPGEQKLDGIPTNKDLAKKWKIIGTASSTEANAAIASGNYARYQIADYSPPERPDIPNYFGFEIDCSKLDDANKFANRFGGSASLRIVAEVYRAGNLVSQHTIVQRFHVKGFLASSSGESSMVLAGNASLNTTEPFIDTDGDGVKGENEPWIDIFCLFCEAVSQSDLRIEVGFQGDMLRTPENGGYGGMIIKGDYVFPKFVFGDTDGNDLFGAGDTILPRALNEIIKDRFTYMPETEDWFPSLYPEAATSYIADPSDKLQNQTIQNIPIYTYDGFMYAKSTALVDITFCGKTENTPNVCSSSQNGDIADIKISSKSTGTPTITGSLPNGWIRRADVCGLAKGSVTGVDCSSSYFGIGLNKPDVTPVFKLDDLTSESDCFPYDDCTSKSSYINQCSLITSMQDLEFGPYIGCVFSKIALDSGKRKVYVVDNPGNIPVYIFVQSAGVVLDFTGGNGIINCTSYDSVAGCIDGKGNNNDTNPDPNRVAIFGLPPTQDDPTKEVCTEQTISLAGDQSIDGLWLWFPRGGILSGVGTSSIKGRVWVCDFDGRGNFKFMGSNFSPTLGDCGTNLPCGLYKYRAQGIAKIDRKP